MFENIRKSIDLFSGGFALTDSERKAFEDAERINAENEEAILQGYSVSSRQTIIPEIPGLVDRIRRGLQNALVRQG